MCIKLTVELTEMSSILKSIIVAMLLYSLVPKEYTLARTLVRYKQYNSDSLYTGVLEYRYILCYFQMSPDPSLDLSIVMMCILIWLDFKMKERESKDNNFATSSQSK